MSDANPTELCERVFRPLVFTTLAATALAPAAFGHHSPVQYDMTREVVLEGTVTKLEWKNPHILLTLETRSAGGERVVRDIEASAVSMARTWGLPREALAPGQHVVVRARPGRRSPEARALGIDVRTDDGAVYLLSLDSGPGLARPTAGAQAHGLAGRWVPTFESFFGVFTSAQSMPFTEAGRAAHAETRSTVLSGRARICELDPSAFRLAILPDLRTIEVGETSVVIRFEIAGVHQQRIVHLDQTEHPANLAPSLLGHSIGRWEGETLVIDTVAIAPHPEGNLVLPSTLSTHLVERLTLTEDRRQLEYGLTLEDPAYLTGPASYTATWDYRPDLESSDEVCDPEIARRVLAE